MPDKNFVQNKLTIFNLSLPINEFIIIFKYLNAYEISFDSSIEHYDAIILIDY